MAYRAFDLTGKTALITGGNSGIGLGMAEALAQAGAAVCIWGTNSEKNSKALKQIQSHGGKAIALHCDVGDEQEVEQRFAETVAALGPVHACFANAGVSGRGNVESFADMDTAEWKRVTRVNLDGAFYTLRAAARHMTGHGKGGALVGTASLAAISGAPLGPAGGFRRDRRVPRQRCEQLPHRRHIPHRRGLLALLTIMSAERRVSMLWWLGFLAAFGIPVLWAVLVWEYGRAYPGTLPTAVAEWGASLAWVVGAVVAVRQLDSARKAPLLRSIARIAVILIFGFSAVSLHFVSSCEPRTDYVGGPRPQQSGSVVAQASSQATCR